MRTVRLLLFLFSLFAVCFFYGGGGDLFSNPTGALTAAVEKQLAPALPAADGDAAANGEESASLYHSAYRFAFLGSAVESQVAQRKTHYLPLDEIGLPVQQAIIAVEDSRFYSHYGFDPTGMLRALLVNLQFGGIEEGASTITQQLSKNLFLSHERSVGRKAEEFLLALDMEARYSKEKILELYLNTIYFGSGFYGIYDAANGYFAKTPQELTLAEAAMLAGLPNAPSLYSPYVDFQAAKKRQAIVLERMVKAGVLSPSMAEAAKQEKIALAH